MKRINYIPLLLLGVLSTACVRQTVNDMPQAELTVSWINSRQSDAHKDATFYIYPQFDYVMQPYELTSVNGNPVSVELRPGRYKVLMVNSPIDPVKLDGKSDFAKLNTYLDPQNGRLPTIPQIMGLSVDDKLREINVEIGAENKFVLTPVSISKKIHFVINGDKFGLVNVVEGYLSGVSSRVNLSTLQKSESSAVRIADWTIDGRKFTSAPVEVLGFNYETGKIVLTLLVTNPEVTVPLEQPVDLTKEISEMRGDEIEITLNIDFNPDIRVQKVSIREWEAGNELEIDI